ncbi:MAG: hypothetical protein ACK50A_06625 [Sphingobacteriaceae bacterium]|jgi:hypothetical protein
MKPNNNENMILKLALLISCMLYFFLSYFIKREDSILLFSSFAALFAIYFYLISRPNLSEHNFLILIASAFFFRFIFIVATPALSDDFYRFIWDGRLAAKGINPFVYLPDYVNSQVLLNGSENLELYSKMNSPHYYSVYPPVLQFLFFISGKLSFGSNFVAIVILRVFILCAEFGTFYFLKKILEHLELSKSKALVYLLNPLVILELSGNLHFEGVMLFFITASIYYLLINNLLYSASLFSLAVSTKMIPLILLPIFVKSVGFKKGFIYSAIVAVLSVVLFLPFINQQLITNIGNSVGLYFQKFEFNASFYYLFRWLGFQFSGYNEIAIIGKVLPIVSLILILIISLKDFVKEINSAFFQKVLLILFVYYLFSLIIHPWYVTFLVLISVFLKSRFAIIWSILIFGSYLAYSTLPYKENMVIVWIEYSVVLAWYYCEKKGLKFTQIFN